MRYHCATSALLALLRAEMTLSDHAGVSQFRDARVANYAHQKKFGTKRSHSPLWAATIAMTISRFT